MRLPIWLIGTLGFALPLALPGNAVAAEAQAAVKIGGICDRTGAAKIIGLEYCPAVADYMALVNRKGGVLGHRLEYTEVESAYMVDRAIDGYEQLKRDGAITIMSFGVPVLIALTPRYTADRIPAFNSGTGIGDAIDGEAWPYIFPGTASYWSQAGVVMKYLKDNGAKKGTKIAYLYFDNPAGRDGIAMVEAVARKEGYVVRKFAVQPPGLEVGRQVNELTVDFKPDWVIASLFGKSPAVAIREFRKANFPLSRVISFVWGAGNVDVEEAGWDVAQGYLGLQFAALGRTPSVIRDIIQMYRDQGKEVPKYIGSAYYNRGALHGALIAEGVRIAIQNHGLPVTPEKVRKGHEAIKNFDANGLGPSLTITPKDHEGGGYLRVYQVTGTEWVPVSGWIRDYRDEVMTLVRAANKK
jgi:branched-chain amino acid transport system substrate-binding protein